MARAGSGRAQYADLARSAAELRLDALNQVAESCATIVWIGCVNIEDNRLLQLASTQGPLPTPGSKPPRKREVSRRASRSGTTAGSIGSAPPLPTEVLLSPLAVGGSTGRSVKSSSTSPASRLDPVHRGTLKSTDVREGPAFTVGLAPDFDPPCRARTATKLAVNEGRMKWTTSLHRLANGDSS